MIKIFVYGTLKKGGRLHEIISQFKENKFVKNYTLKNYTLYAYPQLYPIAVQHVGKQVDGEIWEINNTRCYYYIRSDFLFFVTVILIFFHKSLRNKFFYEKSPLL